MDDNATLPGTPNANAQPTADGSQPLFTAPTVTQATPPQVPVAPIQPVQPSIPVAPQPALMGEEGAQQPVQVQPSFQQPMQETNQPAPQASEPFQPFVPPTQPVPPVQEAPLVPPVAPPVLPATQPVPSVADTGAPQPAANESPRLTLQDLYGPSNPGELQPPVTPSLPGVPVEPFQPFVPPVQEFPAPVALPAQEQPLPEKVQETPSVENMQRVTNEPARRMPENVPNVPTSVLPVEQSAKEETVEEVAPAGGGGGFHIGSIVRVLVAIAGIFVVILLLWGVVSFFFSNRNATSGKVNLTYWGLWEDTNVMQPVIADFEKQHPNITVTYTKEDAKDYTKRLLTRMQQGTGPDIFRFHNTWVYPLQSILLPLPTSVIDARNLTANYPPVAAKDLVVNGAVYGLPLEMDALSLFVNTDIFSHAGAAVPTTWDNFITVAKALTVKDPQGHIQTSGAAIGTYDNISHAPDIISLLLLQNGANMQKLQGSQNAIDALSFYTTFAKPNSNVWDNTLDNSLLAFSRGKVAMYFGYSYDIFAIQTANPSMKFAMYPVPHLPGRDITVASYWVEGVSNKSKHQKEALQFMQFLAQKDTQTKIYTEEAKTRGFGELYASTDLANGLTANAQLAPFVAQFKSAQSSIFSADTGYDEYNGALNQYLANAINGMLQETSADSATATLAQGVAQVTSQYAPKTP